MITNKLRDIRFEFKMDQNEFAEMLGVNYTLYNRWENNKQQPSLEWAMKIAEKTNRSIHDFVELNK